jgi:hypothetical protein
MASRAYGDGEFVARAFDARPDIPDPEDRKEKNPEANYFSFSIRNSTPEPA